MPRLLRTLGLVAGLAAGAGVALYWHAVRRPLPSYRERMVLSELDGPVEVLWDAWGVPHIYAETEDDLWLAQGYLHAQDRLWQMELQRRIASGRLSELFGRRTVETDRMLRRMGFRRVAQQEARQLDDATARMLAGYCTGVNAFLARNRHRLPVEFTLLRHQPEPWSPVDTLTWGKLMGWTLALNWEQEVFRARMAALVGPEVLELLEHPYPGHHPVSAVPGHPAPKPPAAAPDFAALSGGGSNAWVVSGARTASGKPLLANDPHLAPQIPSPWYEAHFECPTLRAAGASLPGAPGLFIGHNQHIAWGITAGMADMEDTYLVETRDEGSAYRQDNDWLPTQVIEERISIKGQPADEVERVVITRYGPVFLWEPDGARGYAVRSPLLEPTDGAGAVSLMHASTWAEFRAALDDWPWGSLNFVYADTAGNTGYQLTGRFPRRDGRDGRVSGDGATAADDWNGYLGIDDLPHAYNPPEGYLATANNRPTPDGVETQVQGEWPDGYRASRIVEVLASGKRLTVAQMSALQMDTFSHAARDLLNVVRDIPVTGEVAAGAKARLLGWDCRVRAASGEAALFEAFRRFLVRRLLTPALGEQLDTYFSMRLHAIGASSTFWLRGSSATLALLQKAVSREGGALNLPDASELVTGALDDALAELTERLGPDPATWQWGKLHLLRLQHPLARIAPLRWLFNRGPFAMRGDGDTVLQASFVPVAPYDAARWTPNYRFVADLSDWDACRSVHLPGQSGQPGSRHYDDQAALWLAGETHPMPFSRPAVEAAAVRRSQFAPKTPPTP